MENTVLSFFGIVSVLKYMGSISLKIEFCLSIDRIGILSIILKVADPRNWLFLLWNVV